MRKALYIILHRRRIASFFTQQELPVHQFEHAFEILRKAGMSLQVCFRQDAFAGLPAMPLVDAQDADHLRWGPRPGVREKAIHVRLLATPSIGCSRIFTENWRP